MNGRVLLAAAVAVLVALGALWFGMSGREAAAVAQEAASTVAPAASTTPAAATDAAPAATATTAPETTATDTAASTTTAAPAAPAAAATASSVVSKVPDMVLGQPDAPVTVIEYASFTCSHCANFHATVYPDFKKTYIDSGKVRFIYREVYFDKVGLWAGILARCGGADKYFGISDMLFNKQPEWAGAGSEAGIVEALKMIGLSAGLTADQIQACMADQEQAKAMVTAYQTNATADGVEGTPTFLINGEKHAGEMSYAEFAALLDAKLGK